MQVGVHAPGDSWIRVPSRFHPVEPRSAPQRPTDEDDDDDVGQDELNVPLPDAENEQTRGGGIHHRSCDEGEGGKPREESQGPNPIEERKGGRSKTETNEPKQRTHQNKNTQANEQPISHSPTQGKEGGDSNPHESHHESLRKQSTDLQRAIEAAGCREDDAEDESGDGSRSDEEEEEEEEEEVEESGSEYEVLASEKMRRTG